MRANTCKAATAFADLAPPEEVPMFPRPEEVQAYLRAYASHFGVAERLVTGARVTCVTRAGSAWTVRWNEGSAAVERRFDAVVVASGRFAAPRLPAGLIEPGRPGCHLLHSREYRTRDEFRGLRVLVHGNGASGLEIAADLAAEDSVEVVSACVRPRLVLPKVVRGAPCEWAWLGDYARTAGARVDRDRLESEVRAAAAALTGGQQRWGAPAPHPDVLANGIVHCQGYLPLVAEGRIAVRPAVERLRGGVAQFADGSRGHFDAVVAATGFEPCFPFLPPELRPPPPGGELRLRHRTLHPCLPGLAFLGQYRLHGPYLPVLEAQARWLAALWSRAGGDNAD
jgi:cation diffusion facilitator CzcD-associated flavoprotein CzcO